jgi:hypothetical protein
MGWTLPRPKKHSDFSIPFGSTGENSLFPPSQPTITSPKNRKMPSLKSSLDQTIGSFLSNPTLQHQINFYKLFSQIDLNEYVESFETYEDIEKEIKNIRSHMVEVEKCLAASILLKEEYRLAVSKFTQLFRALLVRKELFMINSR